MATTPDRDFGERSELILDISFKPIHFIYIIDLIVKIVFFLLFILGKIDTWIYLTSIFLPLIITAVIKSRIHSRYKSKTEPKIPVHLRKQFNTLRISYSGNERILGMFLVTGMIISFWFFIRVIHPEHWYTYLLIIILAIFGATLFIAASELALFPKEFRPLDFKIILSSFVSQINDKYGNTNETKDIDVSAEYKELLSEIKNHLDGNLSNKNILVEEDDVNDSQIAKLESNLKNINTKVESYMLESVLIGALTFSGFLAIIVSNEDFKNIDSLKNLVAELTSIFSSSSIDLFSEKLIIFSSPANLLYLIMLESLFCSVFFILILGLRMRFSSLSLKLDYLIRIMLIFNAKEEELINLQFSDPEAAFKLKDRKRKISFKISEAINDANKLEKDIYPVARLMGWYRNIGLILFFIILITSGMFLSINISFAILAIAIFTWLFRVIETKAKLNKVNNLLRRH